MIEDKPWLTDQFIAIFESWITKDWRAWEWGCGGSTLWLSRRVAHLISIEHDPIWWRKIQDALNEAHSNVDLRLTPVDDPRYWRSIIDQNKPFDLVLIDGRKRVLCGRYAMKRIKPGGTLVLDNAERDHYSPLTDALLPWVHHSTDNGKWKTDYWVKP